MVFFLVLGRYFSVYISLFLSFYYNWIINSFNIKTMKFKYLIEYSYEKYNCKVKDFTDEELQDFIKHLYSNNFTVIKVTFLADVTRYYEED